MNRLIMVMSLFCCLGFLSCSPTTDRPPSHYWIGTGLNFQIQYQYKGKPIDHRASANMLYGDIIGLSSFYWESSQRIHRANHRIVERHKNKISYQIVGIGMAFAPHTDVHFFAPQMELKKMGLQNFSYRGYFSLRMNPSFPQIPHITNHSTMLQLPSSFSPNTLKDLGLFVIHIDKENSKK